MVRNSAREFLSREAGPSLARQVLDGQLDAAGEFWRQVSEMGWPGLAIAEEHGGAGMGMTELAALMEQWAAHMAPGPLFESAVMAAPLIEANGTDRLKREVLPGLADGSKSIGIAIIEEQARWDIDAVNAVAVKTGDGWAITGEKRFVAYGDEADWLLVAARHDESPDQFSLFLVDRSSAGVTTEVMDQASGEPVYAVQLNETPVSGDRLIGLEGEGWPLVESMALRGAAFRAVQLAGIGQAALDRTVAYAKERKQFGQPIGSFQAIQHTLADMAVAVRSVRHQAYRAVWSIATGSPDAPRDVARASAAACSLIPDVCWKAHQSHGAIGFTWEHDLHLLTRHSLAYAAEFGGESQSLDALANALSL